MLPRLVASDPAHSWTCFLKSDDRAYPAPSGCHDCVFASLGWNLASNALLLPVYASRRRLDVTLTQYFAAPTLSSQVTVVHDVLFASHPELFSWNERRYLGLIKPLLRWASAVVTVSDTAEEELRALGFVKPTQECFVVHNGVSERFFEPGNPAEIQRVRERYQLPLTFVLYVGRVNIRKNLPQLIKAMASVQGAHLVVVGDAPGDSSAYRALIENLSIADRVHFVGAVPDDDLHHIYAAASACAYLSEHEGFGLPPLEAMASGVPVIAAPAPAVREVCGENPFYVDGQNPRDIADALRLVLTRPMEVTDRVVNGQRRARQFTWDSAAQKLMRILLAQAGRSRSGGKQGA
jgi:glycosyltransferase involved in cell wall biosynthesis